MYPTLADLRSLEKTTLKMFCEIGEFARLGGLQADANAAAAAVNEYKGPINVHLAFTLDIRLRADRKKTQVRRRVDVGALVQPTPDNKSIQNATYSLLICRNAEPTASPIVRKFHIDYEPAKFRNLAEPKPSVHMQFCGNLSPQHLAAGYTELRLQPLYPHFEKPRLPLPPTSLALMVNWLLLEFQSDPASQAVLRNPSWRAHVAKAERTVLAPYYTAATQFLTGAGSAHKGFFQAHLYEMASD